MKKILKYLFILSVCFIGFNKNVLAAKKTTCEYSAALTGAFNYDDGDLIAGSYTVTITIDEKGTLKVKKGVFKEKNSGLEMPGVETKTDFLPAENFIKSNENTKCPPKLYSIAALGGKIEDNKIMEAIRTFLKSTGIPTTQNINDYSRTNIYLSTGRFTDEQKAKIISDNTPKLDEETLLSLTKHENEDLTTSVKGNYAKNQKEVNKKELPTKLDNNSKELIGCGLFGEKTLPIIKRIWRFLRFGVPVLVVVLGIMDFLGIVFSGEEKNFKEAGGKFVKRLIAGVIILFVPYLLTFIINLSGLVNDYNLNTDELFCVFGDVEVAEEKTTTDCSLYSASECSTKIGPDGNRCHTTTNSIGLTVCTNATKLTCDVYTASECNRKVDGDGNKCHTSFDESSNTTVCTGS